MIDNIRYPILALALVYLAICLWKKSIWKKSEIEKVLRSNKFSTVLTLVAVFLFSLIKILQFRAGEISGVDFSHLDYAIWSTAQGRFMEIPIIPENPSFLNFFGNHFSPILFVHVFFRLFLDSPITTLMVHAVSLAMAIPLFSLLAKQYLEQKYANILILTYFFCGAVASTLQFDIHQESFFPLAWALFFLGVRGRVWQLVLGTFLVWSVKEDAGIYLFWACAWLALIQKEKRLILVGVSLLSIAYTFLALKWIMPMHQPTSAEVPYYFTMWARYGSSFSEVIFQMVTHPHWVLADIFGNKALYKNLLPWGFMPVLHPAGAIALAPIAVSSTASGVQSGFGLYYGIILVPLFFYSTCLFLEKSKRKYQWLVVALILSAFVGGSYLRFPSPLSFREELAAAVGKAEKINEGEVWVQSGLLPFLPYQQNWRRLDSLDQIRNLPKGTALFFEGLEQSTVSQSPDEIKKILVESGFQLTEESNRWRKYQK